jgi:hypothetical protein
MRILPVSMAVVGSVLLGGCTSGGLGVTGIVRSDDGTLSIAISSCDRSPGRVFLDRPGAAADQTVKVVRFNAQGRTENPTFVPLTGPSSPNWQAVPATFTLDPGIVYTAEAASADNGYGTTPVSFRLDAMPDLGRDQVLISVFDHEGVVSSAKVITRTAFIAAGKAACDENGAYG